MVSERYVLKHSRLSIVFQLLLLILIAIVLFCAINLMFAVLTVVGMFIGWIWFRRTAQLQYLQHLDQTEWSLKFQNQNAIQRVHLKKMIQHHFYVVIYFEEKKHKSIIIWKDQLELSSWKTLLTRCYLN